MKIRRIIGMSVALLIAGHHEYGKGANAFEKVSENVQALWNLDAIKGAAVVVGASPFVGLGGGSLLSFITYAALHVPSAVLKDYVNEDKLKNTWNQAANLSWASIIFCILKNGYSLWYDRPAKENLVLAMRALNVQLRANQEETSGLRDTQKKMSATIHQLESAVGQLSKKYEVLEQYTLEKSVPAAETPSKASLHELFGRKPSTAATPVGSAAGLKK